MAETQTAEPLKLSGRFLDIDPATSDFPTPERCRYQGSSRLNFRVQDGNGQNYCCQKAHNYDKIRL